MGDGSQQPERETKDILDSLKLEASALSPQDEAVLRSDAQLISTYFKFKWGQYIPEDKLTDKNKAITVNNPIITDRETFNVFVKNYLKVNKFEKLLQSIFPGRFTLDIDSLSPEAINDISAMSFSGRKEKGIDAILIANATELTEKEIADLVIGNFKGDRKAAGEFALTYLRLSNLFHEIVHNFEEHRLPLRIREAAALYYERDFLRGTLGIYFESKEEHQQIEVYENLIQKYGAGRVHEMYFGKKEDFLLVAGMNERLKKTEVENTYGG